MLFRTLSTLPVSFRFRELQPILTENNKAYLLLAMLQRLFVCFCLPFRDTRPLLGQARAFSEGEVLLLFPTLWVVSGKMKGLPVVF